MRRSLALLAGLVALALSPAGAARAEIPALSRDFVTEEFSRTPHDLERLAARHHVALGVSGGAFWAGREAGAWNALRGGRPWGARAEALACAGRWTLGADATNDGALDAEPREYAQRVTLAAHLPEAFTALTGSVGYRQFHHAGTDVSAELAPLRWRWTLRDADVAPRVWFWARWRRLEHDATDIVTPAAALAIQHVPILGSQPVLALSAQSDLAHGRVPQSFGLVQFGFASTPRPLSGGGGDPDMPRPRGAAPPSLTDRNWFVTLAYAFPLDDRAPVRLALQAGMRFVRPYGGPHAGE
jgi:hypothetical protein